MLIEGLLTVEQYALEILGKLHSIYVCAQCSYKTKLINKRQTNKIYASFLTFNHYYYTTFETHLRQIQPLVGDY